MKQVLGYLIVFIGTLTGTNLILGGFKKWQKR